MTSTRRTSTRTTGPSTGGTTGCGGRLFAVVLVAAWTGALAVPSDPSSPAGRQPATSGVLQSAAVPAVSTEVSQLSSRRNTPAS